MIRFIKGAEGNHVLLRVSGDPLLVENIDLYRQSDSKIEATLLRERLQEQLEATMKMIRKTSYYMGWKDAKSKKTPKRECFSSHTDVHDWEKAQVEALQRERDGAYKQGFADALEKVASDWASKEFRGHDEIQGVEVQAFLDSRHVHYEECRGVKPLQTALDAEREKVKGLESEGVKLFEWRLALHSLTPGGSEFCTPDACEQWVRKSRTSQHEYIIEQIKQRKGLQTQLSQLQALVRALPVPEEGGFPIVEVDGDYYVNHTSRFSTKAEADAYTGLLIYRATLDATAPAVCPECNGEGAVDSGGTDPNGNPLMRRCGCREKGGDGE